MLLADYAAVSDGKLTIVGGGWSQTGPEPASFGIGLLIQVPWDQANTRHSFSVELLDAGWSCQSASRSDEDSDQVVAFGGEFEVGSSAGAEAGNAARLPGRRQLDAPAARAGPVRVAAHHRRCVARGLDDAVHRARSEEQ